MQLYPRIERARRVVPSYRSPRPLRQAERARRPFIRLRLVLFPMGMLLFALVGCAGTAPAQSAATDYTLELRYGSTSGESAYESGTAPDAHFLHAARRLDVAVRPRDQGRLSVNHARLVYTIDAESPAPGIDLGIELSYSTARGTHSLQTQVTLLPDRWLALAGTADEQTDTDTGTITSGGSAVFVRIKSD